MTPPTDDLVYPLCNSRDLVDGGRAVSFMAHNTWVGTVTVTISRASVTVSAPGWSAVGGRRGEAR